MRPEVRPALLVPALLLSLALPACGGAADAPPDAAAEADEAAAGEPEEIRVGGLAAPESALHDPAADVYLVSNINGNPLEKDGNGFISRVSPEGVVTEPRWIDGSAEGVELNAPKGMAVRGDSLYVADIDCVRIFHRMTGAAEGEVCIDGATFLNDVALAPDGQLYVTDTGMRAGGAGFEPTGADAVWRFTPEGEMVAVATGGQLGNPNGIAFGPQGGTVVTFGSGEVYLLAQNGTRNEVLAPVQGRQLDGIAFVPEGGFLISSWGESAVLFVSPEGVAEQVVTDVPGPADIGYDAQRGRVLIPLLMANELLIREVRLGG